VDIVLSRAPLRGKTVGVTRGSGPEVASGSSFLQTRKNLQTRKKAVVANGPKFREETPKKGSNTATPIAVLHCNN
jgi:hypothetical protein